MDLVAILLEAGQLLAPLIAGLLTVPITRLITNASDLLDRAPGPVKQTIAASVASALTNLGAALQVALPTELALFTGDTTEALLAAAIAFGVHAGKKARTPSPKLLSLLAVLMVPSAAACQTGSPTVTVVDRSLVAVNVTPPTFTGEVGDTPPPRGTTGS